MRFLHLQERDSYKCNFHKSAMVTAFFLKHFSIQLRHFNNNLCLILTIIALYFFTIFYLSSCHPIIRTLKQEQPWLCICIVQGTACCFFSAILLCSIVVLHSYINSGKSSGVYKPSFYEIYTLSHHSFFAYIYSTLST